MTPFWWFMLGVCVGMGVVCVAWLFCTTCSRILTKGYEE